MTFGEKMKSTEIKTTRQTLVDIYQPAFRAGHQLGRQHYFKEKNVFTDKELVETLQIVFEENGREEDAKEREEGVYYSVGYLVGQLSGCVLPHQPSEDNNPQGLQDAFLTKVLQGYGAAGQALSHTIQQFWHMQDMLAQTLEADMFEQMLCRGVEKSIL